MHAAVPRASVGGIRNAAMHEVTAALPAGLTNNAVEKIKRQTLQENTHNSSDEAFDTWNKMYEVVT